MKKIITLSFILSIFWQMTLAERSTPSNSFGQIEGQSFYANKKDISSSEISVIKKLLLPGSWVSDFISNRRLQNHGIEVTYAFKVKTPIDAIDLNIFTDPKNLTSLNRTTVYQNTKSKNRFEATTEKTFFKTKFTAKLNFLPEQPDNIWEHIIKKLGIFGQKINGFKLSTDEYNTAFMKSTDTFFIFVEAGEEETLVIGYSLMLLNDSPFGSSIFRSSVLNDVQAKTKYLVEQFQSLIKESIPK